MGVQGMLCGLLEPDKEQADSEPSCAEPLQRGQAFVQQELTNEIRLLGELSGHELCGGVSGEVDMNVLAGHALHQ